MKLPKDVMKEVREKTLVYILCDVPALENNHGPRKSIIVLPDSMRRWSQGAIMGTIALMLAQVVSGETDNETITNLAIKWGFEKEVRLSQRKMHGIKILSVTYRGLPAYQLFPHTLDEFESHGV